MLTKRIIPCLDVDGGRVVKGIQFVGLRDAGDPAELAEYYNAEGADEIVFLDITASSDSRQTMVDVVERTADRVFIPLTVGGGIRSVENMHRLLRSGADKISLNTAAVQRPELITEGAARFGVQCIVVAIDARRLGPGRWEVFTHGGRRGTGRDVVAWAQEAERRGAGEILLTSMDEDGRKDGFDVSLTAAVSDAVGIPVIASGGGGVASHFADVLSEGKADAALAASIFHFRETSIVDLKRKLAEAGLPMRLTGNERSRAEVQSP